MKNSLLIIFTFILSLQSQSQIPQSLLEEHSYQDTYDLQNYLGSIYKTMKFESASVIEEKSSVYEAEVRYNIDGEIFEYNFGDISYQIKKDPRIHIRINKEYFYFCEFKTENFLPVSGYYVLVDLNDDYRLYKKYSLDIKHPDKFGGADQTPTPGNLRMETTYYIEENGYIKELPTNKNSALAAFQDKKEELKKYLKSEKLKLKNEEDLIRFVSRYNALKSSNFGKSRSLLVNRVGRN